MTQPRVLTVLSWNVLADKYALPERYPEIEERYLARKPRSRHTEIIVARSHADVICLQEVDVKLFEMLERTLGADGYQSDFAPMTPNMVGVATFIAP